MIVNYKLKTKIGLEIHIELKTKTKMFCRCPNQRDGQPNEFVCPICLGYPGVLPVPNKKAVLFTIKLGVALHCEISDESKFDRKHYFYPDLPKNYQISQYDMPLAKNGYLEIGDRKIGVRRVHLEEDAGKLIHPQGVDFSLVDFNRAGVPLVEVVTEPDITSAEEAKDFLKELQLVVRYLNISRADMEKGELRCDANISVYNEKGSTPVFEIKNMNSFRAVESALAYEEAKLKKQFARLVGKEGKKTLTWLEAQQKTLEMRKKEEAADYRYFPEPDIPLMRPKETFSVSKIKEQQPELPAERRRRLIEEFQLPVKEAEVLVRKPSWYEYFLAVAKNNPALAADWIINENLGISLDKEDFILLIQALQKKEAARAFIKQTVLPQWQQGKSIKELLSKGKQKLDIDTVLKKVIEENPEAVANYRKGKVQALRFLIGQVMRVTQGRADPLEVGRRLKEVLK